MFVEIVNLTDGPGKKPTQIDIYGRVVGPGESIKIPAELVDKRLRSLSDAGNLAIGPVPSWYAAAKVKKARVLSPDEVRKKITPKGTLPPPAVKEKKEEKSTGVLKKGKREALSLVDSPASEDDLKLESKRG